MARAEEVALDAGDCRLHAQATVPEPAVAVRAAILAVHGYNSSVDEFGAAPQEWARQGIAALTFDQRGCGQSPGEPGGVAARTVAKDLAAATAWLSARVPPGTPLHVVGHSFGGLHAMAALGAGAGFRSLVLAHTPDRLWDGVPAWQRPFAALGGWASGRRVRRGKPPIRVSYRMPSSRLFVSLEAARAHGRPDVVVRQAQLGGPAWSERLRGTELARRVGVPALVVTSPNDRLVPERSTLRVKDALPGPVTHLRHGGGHACFRDLDAPRVAAAVASFVLGAA